MNRRTAISRHVALEEAAHMVAGLAFGLRIDGFVIGRKSGEVMATMCRDDPDAEGAFYMAGVAALFLAGMPAETLVGSTVDETRARRLARVHGLDETAALRRWRRLALDALTDRWGSVEQVADRLRAGILEIDLNQMDGGERCLT